MIKYKFDVMKALKERGYSSARMRKEKILGEAIMQKLRTGSTEITAATINTICCILRCQPGDLIECDITDEEKIKYFS